MKIIFFVQTVIFVLLILGEVVNEHTVWTLALVLKALNSSFSQDSTRYPELFSVDFVKRIVHLATLGTNLSQAWMLSDIEVSSSNDCSTFT